MRKLKKSLSIILAALMIMSVMAISAGASSYELTKIEGMYESAAPTYYETFDTAEKATAFDATAAFDEAGQRIKFTRDGANATTHGHAFKNIIDQDGKEYVEFDVWMDSTIGRVEVRLGRGSKDIVTRLYLFADGTLSALINGGRYDTNFPVNVNGKNTVKILADCDTDKSYVWLNGNLCQWNVDGIPCDEIPFGASQTYWDRILFYFPEIENASGSVYIDNFKITPLVEKSIGLPMSNGTYLCNENFNSYDEGDLVKATDNTIEEILATDLVGEKAILNTTTTGTGGSAAHKLIVHKEADGNKVLKSPDERWGYVHNLFYTKASTYENPDNNLVVQVKLKAVSEDKNAVFFADLGSRNEGTHKLNMSISKTGVNVSNGSATETATETNYIDGQWHTITYLLERVNGTNGMASIWIDNTLIRKDVVCKNDISSEWPASVYLRNKSNTANNMDIYIDDLIAFDGSSFVNVKNMDAALTEIADFSDMGTDSAPVDFSADVLKEAAGVTSETATATFKDSKGYFNGENIVFPLYEDTTDVLVEIADGNVKTMKEFTNVPIKPAYSISAKTPSTDISNVADFNAGAISATVRNAASNISGRLNIFAAIYESEGGKLLKVEKQTDTLGNDDKFECTLDLSGFAETDLTNAVIKLFIFENGTLVPLN